MLSEYPLIWSELKTVSVKIYSRSERTIQHLLVRAYKAIYPLKF